MTDKLLIGIAVSVANMAKTELRNKRSFTAIICTYNEGQGVFRMRKLEKTLCDLAGENWLNSGDAKEQVFGLIRFCLAAMPQEVFAFCTVATDFRPTAQFDVLPYDQQAQIASGGDMWERVKEGLFVPEDALVVTVQTPERVCLYRQRLQGSLLIGDPDSGCIDQAQFSGRLKMFGVKDDVPAGGTGYRM